MSDRSLGRPGVLALAAIVVLVDQISKHWMSSALADGRTIQAVPGLLDFKLVFNTGAAFSVLTGSTLLLGLLSLTVAVVVMVWLWKQRRLTLWQGLAVAFLLGGTIGNGLDRWRLGYVIDFLALVPIDFPIFNAADVAINLAVICFAFDLLTARESTRRG